MVLITLKEFLLPLMLTTMEMLEQGSDILKGRFEMKKLFVILLVSIMVFSITACSKTIKSEDGSTTTIKDGKLTHEDEGGSAVFEASKEGVDLPDGYPQNLVPIIDDSVVVTASTEKASAGREYWISIMTKQEVTEVVDFYEGVMSDAEDSSIIAVENMSIITGTKDDFYVTITINPSDESDYKTLISIITAKEK